MVNCLWYFQTGLTDYPVDTPDVQGMCFGQSSPVQQDWQEHFPWAMNPVFIPYLYDYTDAPGKRRSA